MPLLARGSLANNYKKSLRSGLDRAVESLLSYVIPVAKGSWRFWQKLPRQLQYLILVALGVYFLREPFLEFILPHIAVEGSLGFKSSFEIDAKIDMSYNP